MFAELTQLGRVSGNYLRLFWRQSVFAPDGTLDKQAAVTQERRPAGRRRRLPSVFPDPEPPKESLARWDLLVWSPLGAKEEIGGTIMNGQTWTNCHLRAQT